MTSNFEHQESSDTDSSWDDFTDQVWNSSIEDDKVTFYKSFPQPSNVMDLHELSDSDTKISSSSEDFQVIDNIESLLCGDKSSDADSRVLFLKKAEGVRDCNEEIKVPTLSSKAFGVFDDVEVVSNKQQGYNEKCEDEKTSKFVAVYTSLFKNLPDSGKKVAGFDKFDDNRTNESVTSSDDELDKLQPPRKLSSKASIEDFFEDQHCRRMCKWRKECAKKATFHRSLFLFLIGVLFSVSVYELGRIWDERAIESKTSPTKPTFILTKTSAPVETSNPGWQALTGELKPVINKCNSLGNANIGKEMGEMQGISLTLVKNRMVISIGVDKQKTYVIYEKDGTIDVKMLPEKLMNNTELLFTLPKKEKVSDDTTKGRLFIKAMRSIIRLIDNLIWSLLLFIKILLALTFTFFEFILNLDDSRIFKNLCKLTFP